MKDVAHIPNKNKTAIVMPAVSSDEAVRSWNAYQDLKSKIVEPNDIQNLSGKEFLKKSYWRKIATFFNLSVEIIEERKEEVKNTTVYYFTCKALAPNGRYATGTGSCELNEKGRINTHHNARSTAETRAYNRAVSNLVGGGEVSAEEINGSVWNNTNVTNNKDFDKTENKPQKCTECQAVGKYHKPGCSLAQYEQTLDSWKS